ncbi:MAG TPA: flagellar biosynthesis protein FlhF [Pirellulaceae bacterium]|nr:flagellar biosynthesis protein FlhF [Pirellulaceae bacterium]
MDVKTYRASSLQEALQQVRRDLGPEASVLHTREVSGGMLRWMAGRQIEVTASATINVPSRLPAKPATSALPSKSKPLPPADYDDFRAKYRADLKDTATESESLVEHLSLESAKSSKSELPGALFQLFTDLIDAELSEELARELLEKVRIGLSADDLADRLLVKSRVARLLEGELKCCGPIRVTPGTRRIVALVGPTGVGKTTTIAKLAANFHLREKQRVGLITVDTYRIAAVDQLRTYADIIDLPMEVVSTPREMRAAIARLSGLDLILMDTAGRSPQDDLRIQELKTMLNEAHADEVHVVLSAVASTASMKQAAERFAEMGATSMLLTKLDETTGLGNILPVLRNSNLSLSYITNGQDVPGDITSADRRKLARAMLGADRD